MLERHLNEGSSLESEWCLRILFVRSYLELNDCSTFSFRSLVSFVQLLV
jgi:hypothetical protein